MPGSPRATTETKVKPWMVAWTPAGWHSKPPAQLLVLSLPVLLLAVAFVVFPAVRLSGAERSIDYAINQSQYCPCPLLDGLAVLEHRLDNVLSNLTHYESSDNVLSMCEADNGAPCGDAAGVVQLQSDWPRVSQHCSAFCEGLTNDLHTTCSLIHGLLQSTSACSRNRSGAFTLLFWWFAAGLAALLFGLVAAVAASSAKGHSCGSGPSLNSFLEGVLHIYKTGTSKYAEVLSQEPDSTSSELLSELQKLRTVKSERLSAASELARLQQEVSELSGVEHTLEQVKEEHERLKAAAALVATFEERNAELATTAAQLDAVSASNTDLRNTVNKVLELRAQNQQLQPIAALLESVSAKHEQLQQAASQVLDLQNQNQQLQSTANLYDNVKATNVNLQQLVAQVVELEAQNQQLRATASLLDLVKAANTELLEAAAQVHELQSQNQQLQSTASMLDQARAVNTKLREMVLQVQELQAQNRQLQASASFLHSVKALNADLQDRVVQVQRLQRGSLVTTPSPKDLLVLRDQEPRSSAPQTPTSILTSPRSHESDCGRNRVFIGGLAATVDEQSLAGCFEKYGTVLGAKVVRSAKGQQSRGYGFVTFQLPEHADLAVDAVKDMMALLKPKENGLYERLTIDYSTSSHLD